MTKPPVITVRLPPVLKTAVERYAKADGVSVQVFVMRVLEGECDARYQYLNPAKPT